MTPQQPLSFRWVDAASKLGAVSLVGIYALGYVVTSIHLASSGMGFANPFKPRTAAAGVLFCLFVGIPLWLSGEVIRREGIAVPSMPSQSLAALLYKFTHFFHVCFVTAIPLSVVFAFTDASGMWRLYTAGTLIVLESSFVVTANLSKALAGWVPKHLRIVGVSYLGLNVIYVLLTLTSIPHHSFSWVQLPLWLYGCGVFVQTIRPIGTSPFGGSWPQQVGQCLIPLSLFSTLLYPHIKSEWGGGEPVSIVVRFTKDSVLFASQKVAMKQLDEGETGIYVLLHGQKHALFIPRSNIAAIAYSTNDADMP